MNTLVSWCPGKSRCDPCPPKPPQGPYKSWEVIIEVLEMFSRTSASSNITSVFIYQDLGQITIMGGPSGVAVAIGVRQPMPPEGYLDPAYSGYSYWIEYRSRAFNIVPLDPFASVAPYDLPIISSGPLTLSGFTNVDYNAITDAQNAAIAQGSLNPPPHQ